MMEDFEYEWLPSPFAAHDHSILSECAALYSEHYGKWSKNCPDETKRGKNIRLSPKKIAEWLSSKDSSLYTARWRGKIVGYAIAIRTQSPRTKRLFAWVTQLIVHSEYRNTGIAKNLLHSIWGFSDYESWGLISASPYAVRALERTTRRRCSPNEVKKHLDDILNIGEQNTPYVSKNQEYAVTPQTAKINTNFYVDHSNVDYMINQVSKNGIPWALGTQLDEGWEWIAFTFQHQKQESLSTNEIRSMLATSDQIVKAAYNRMVLTEQHVWTKHTKSEVSFIISECGLKQGDLVIDFGCGNGRHAIELAHCGMTVIGADYSESHIRTAGANSKDVTAAFHLTDCRYADFGYSTADVTICLYDVVGSYANQEDNKRLLKNLYLHLKPGGHAILSVMNYDVTAKNAKNTFCLSKQPDVLLSLASSNTMETTGNVFKPDFYAVDTEEHIVYRKEQFRQGNQLPAEYIVRDRRFTKNEIVELCASVGFEVVFCRSVRLGHWQEEDENGKELLVKCRKPASPAASVPGLLPFPE